MFTVIHEPTGEIVATSKDLLELKQMVEARGDTDLVIYSSKTGALYVFDGVRWDVETEEDVREALYAGENIYQRIRR